MEAYLAKNISSMMVQDEVLRQLVEVIVVNDGSKDRTSEIAHEFAEKYPGCVTVIDKANGNYGSCINVGLGAARGRYIKILDADDTFNTDTFALYLSYLASLNTEIDLIITDYVVVNEEDEVQRYQTYDFPQDKIFSVEELLRTSCYLSMHAYTYRTEMLREMEYEQLEGVSYTDTEWIWLPLACVSSIRYCPLSVYRYLRGREGQTMDPAIRSKNQWMHVKIMIHALEQIEKFGTKQGFGSMMYVKKITREKLRHMYQSAVFKSGEFSALDLGEFDKAIKKISMETYDYLEGLVYSRRIPYHFVSGWRKKSIFAPWMRLICKLYSWAITK